MHHRALHAHLFPGDGNEAVAFALCGRARREDQELLLVREILTVPYELCAVRTPSRVTWQGRALDSILNRALNEGLALVKIHSHPGGQPWFSTTDDVADSTLFPSISGWLGDDQGPMASLIMLPDGRLVGRSMWGGQIGDQLDAIRVAGDDFRYWFPDEQIEVPSHGARVAQAFGEATYAQLRRLKIGVVGCSGTGSVVIEQLARNGVGKLVLVDNDHVEDKNLNRIVSSTKADALARANKTLVQARSIAAMGLGTLVTVHPHDLLDIRALRDLSTCDLVVGCMDTVDGRHILNKLASAYLIPYVDLGVRLDADGAGGIGSIWLAIHTLQPGGSSLKSRRVYDQGDLEAAFMLRDSPEEYERLRREGYIKGVKVDRPAVISVNMAAAAAAVNEFLARLHGFRLQPNAAFALRRICLTDPEASMDEGDGAPCSEMLRLLGTGDQDPFLGMMRLRN
ncbi:MAG: ThiF family adenylyltransferase [Pseudomonadota bacterium]